MTGQRAGHDWTGQRTGKDMTEQDKGQNMGQDMGQDKTMANYTKQTTVFHYDLVTTKDVYCRIVLQ